jgi:hypothetical protein
MTSQIASWIISGKRRATRGCLLGANHASVTVAALGLFENPFRYRSNISSKRVGKVALRLYWAAVPAGSSAKSAEGFVQGVLLQ